MFIYYVSATIGNTEIGELPIFKHLSSSVNEVKLRSKSYDGYKICVDQAQKFIGDVVIHLNQGGGNYFIQISRNPKFGESDEQDIGVPGIGILNTWHDDELCRFYLINGAEKDESGVFLTKLIVSILSKQNKKGN